MEEMFSDVFMLGVYGYAVAKFGWMVFRKRHKFVAASEGSVFAMDVESLLPFRKG